MESITKAMKTKRDNVRIIFTSTEIHIGNNRKAFLRKNISMAETTKPIVAKARENIISDRPVTSFLSMRIIL
jgi:hypothetical protein